MRESTWQAEFIRHIKNKNCYSVKIMSCNRYGFPDLIVFLPKGGVVLFECKAYKKKANVSQENVHTALKNLDHECFTCDNFKDATRIFDLELSLAENL